MTKWEGSPAAGFLDAVGIDIVFELPIVAVEHIEVDVAVMSADVRGDGKLPQPPLFHLGLGDGIVGYPRVVAGEPRVYVAVAEVLVGVDDGSDMVMPLDDAQPVECQLADAVALAPHDAVVYLDVEHGWEVATCQFGMVDEVLRLFLGGALAAQEVVGADGDAAPPGVLAVVKIGGVMVIGSLGCLHDGEADGQEEVGIGLLAWHLAPFVGLEKQVFPVDDALVARRVDAIHLVGGMVCHLRRVDREDAFLPYTERDMPLGVVVLIASEALLAVLPPVADVGMSVLVPCNAETMEFPVLEFAVVFVFRRGEMTLADAAVLPFASVDIAVGTTHLALADGRAPAHEAVPRAPLSYVLGGGDMA